MLLSQARRDEPGCVDVIVIVSVDGDGDGDGDGDVAVGGSSASRQARGIERDPGASRRRSRRADCLLAVSLD